jgi:hypothetical protein
VFLLHYCVCFISIASVVWHVTGRWNADIASREHDTRFICLDEAAARMKAVATGRGFRFPYASQLAADFMMEHRWRGQAPTASFCRSAWLVKSWVVAGLINHIGLRAIRTYLVGDHDEVVIAKAF